MAVSFHELRVSSVEKLTEDAVAVRFDVPADHEDEFGFTPGQYLTLRTSIDGEEVRRSYSICSTPEDGLRVGIKKVEGGRFSSFAQSLQPDDTLEVMPPEGRFLCTPDENASRDIILIAAGSGITPVLSIAASLLESEPATSVTLIYGNRQTTSIMFREEIEDLKDQHLERFHAYHVLSREAQDVDLFHGRIDVERIGTFVENGIISPSSADGIYICGPAEMTLSLIEKFKSEGIDETKLHSELFEAPGEDKPVKISQQTRDLAEEGVGIEIILDGLHREFVLSDAADTVLQAAEKSGLDLPFSCAGGMCATCRCKLVDGDGEMDKNYSLDNWEVEAGFVLACQLRPKSQSLKLDFDAA